MRMLICLACLLSLSALARDCGRCCPSVPPICVSFVGAGAEVRSMDGSNRLIASFPDVTSILAQAKDHDAGVILISQMAQKSLLPNANVAPVVASAEPIASVVPARVRHAAVIEDVPCDPIYYLRVKPSPKARICDLLDANPANVAAEAPVPEAVLPAPVKTVELSAPAVVASKPVPVELSKDKPAELIFVQDAKELACSSCSTCQANRKSTCSPVSIETIALTVKIVEHKAEVYTMQGQLIGHFEDVRAVFERHSERTDVIVELAGIARRQASLGASSSTTYKPGLPSP